MKKTMLIAAALSLLIGNALPVASEEAAGQVDEVLMKVMTADGPRWFRVGGKIDAVDVTEGAVIQFSYEGDTIEAITVAPECPAGQENCPPPN